MIGAALLLLATPPAEGQEGIAAASAAEAERVLAREAQVRGQWTALRRYAEKGAMVIGRSAIAAEEALAKPDPPLVPVWWVADSYVSCDGNFAVNTGPWLKGHASGYFTTLWTRSPDGKWRWAIDFGDGLETPRPARNGPRLHRASCENRPASDRRNAAETGADGESLTDGTLVYRWRVRPDGGRSFSVMLWNGRAYEQVILDTVAPEAR